MDPTHALELWRQFPARALPRPIVLVDGYVHVQSRGFVDGDAKIAFITGGIDAADGVEVPAPVLALLRDRSREAVGAHLVITSVDRVHFQFMTDRGKIALPSYALTMPGVHEPVIVLDPATPVWWPTAPVAELPMRTGRATIEADHRTLHVIARGSALTEFIRCDLIETEAAVLAIPVTTERPVQPGTAIRAMGVNRPVTGILRHPLDGRALIDPAGNPIVVEPISPPDQ